MNVHTKMHVSSPSIYLIVSPAPQNRPHAMPYHTTQHNTTQHNTTVPADVLKEVFQAETVLACDIGADVRMTGRQDYGDTLTGLQILLNMLPWSKTLQVRL